MAKRRRTGRRDCCTSPIEKIIPTARFLSFGLRPALRMAILEQAILEAEGGHPFLRRQCLGTPVFHLAGVRLPGPARGQRARGQGLDRLAEIAQGFGIFGALTAIDRKLRATGLQPDDTAWTVALAPAIERPDHAERAPHAIVKLHDAAIATSGDYRHRLAVGEERLAHSMDPARRRPLAKSPASVMVDAKTCTLADARATALMVCGSLEGADLARRHDPDALFPDRDGNKLCETRLRRLSKPRAEHGRMALAARCAG